MTESSGLWPQSVEPFGAYWVKENIQGWSVTEDEAFHRLKWLQLWDYSILFATPVLLKRSKIPLIIPQAMDKSSPLYYYSVASWLRATILGDRLIIGRH